MTHWEKRSWIMLVQAVVAYGVYLVLVARSAAGGPLVGAAYVVPLLGTVGGAVVFSVVAETVLAVVDPRASRVSDERDREIARLGEHTGQAFVVIGAVAAMLMAMAAWDGFWIANVVYLCFVLSAVLGSVARIVVYRGAMPQW